MVIAVILWVIVGLVLIYSVVPNLLTRVFHMFAVRTGERESSVYLTFDDGPDEKYTPGLLDALNAAGIRATFFVIADKAARHPEIIQRMLEDGHDVQIHGLTHAFVPLLSPFQAIAQIRRSAEILKEHFGLKAVFYRPTWGLLNLTTLMYAWFASCRVITWSIMVGDWRNTDSDTLLLRIQRRLQEKSVIVLHDSDETPGAEQGAPLNVIELIPKLGIAARTKGLEFRTMQEWR
ncbi:polysaccharide deacetylase family protein [Alicyclobacillus tolerans]|uniref:polysaccharide deacetylase family protein n=1 Tax=Alicyclobacillus tolerans TaxID=90970 RepID=UPI001F21346A|nr:polysaccharide deacetylase family protein [Alicyclobacillus tolerans]MCF8563433.1 polysaccharide deacetylase family protein [Alicyclobacillus tolerans]